MKMMKQSPKSHSRNSFFSSNFSGLPSGNQLGGLLENPPCISKIFPAMMTPEGNSRVTPLDYPILKYIQDYPGY
jgi:hypothetical protein